MQHMDATGIDIQVLSYGSPGTQVLPASEAVPLACEANDQLAAAIAAHPDRFAGFATVPTPDPQAAAGEFERAVHQLGFVGAMINGHTEDRFLDDPQPGQQTDRSPDYALGVPVFRRGRSAAYPPRPWP